MRADTSVRIAIMMFVMRTEREQAVFAVRAGRGTPVSGEKEHT